MNKKRLDEIARRAEAKFFVLGSKSAADCIDLLRQDIRDLLAYVEELEKALVPLVHAQRAGRPHAIFSPPLDGSSRSFVVTEHAVKFAKRVMSEEVE